MEGSSVDLEEPFLPFVEEGWSSIRTSPLIMTDLRRSKTRNIKPNFFQTENSTKLFSSPRVQFLPVVHDDRARLLHHCEDHDGAEGAPRGQGEVAEGPQLLGELLRRKRDRRMRLIDSSLI